MDYPAEEASDGGLRPAVCPWPWTWRRHLLFSLLASPSPATSRPRRDYVSWDETAAAHLFSASLPGVRKEEIRVEVEDARYLVIRTELDDGGDGKSGFTRKFRLPGMVDAGGISAEYTHGVLTVKVPRMHTRARPVVSLHGDGPSRDPVARAA